MKFVFSFFIVLTTMVGFVPEAEAGTTVTTVERVCTVEKQYQPTHLNRRGHLVSGHYKKITVCRNVPRTVIHRSHHRHLLRPHHRHHHRHGVRVAIRL